MSEILPLFDIQRAFLFKITLVAESLSQESQNRNLAQTTKNEELNKNFQLNRADKSYNKLETSTEHLSQELYNAWGKLKQSILNNNPSIFLYNNQSLFLIILEHFKLQAIHSSKALANEIEKTVNTNRSDILPTAIDLTAANHNLVTSKHLIKVKIEDLSVNKIENLSGDQKLKKARPMRALSGPLRKLFKEGSVSDPVLDPNACNVKSLEVDKKTFWEYWAIVKKGGKIKDFFFEKVGAS